MQRSLWPKKRAKQSLNRISIKSSQPDPNPDPRNEQASKIRRVIYMQMLFTLIFFYALLDASSRVSSVIEFIWGEAYRAILVGGQTQQNLKVDFFDSNGSGVSATVTLPDAGGAPLSEVLGHWLAGDSPTILDNSGGLIEIASVEFRLPIRTLEREVFVAISKTGASEFEDMYKEDVWNLSAIAARQDTKETEWPPDVATYFKKNCKVNPNFGLSFITKNRSDSSYDLSTEDEFLAYAATEDKHVLSMSKIDLSVKMQTDRFGPIPGMRLERSYRLNLKPTNDTTPPCGHFVPELQWINGTYYISRGTWGLDESRGPLLNFWTIDGAPEQRDLDRLIERLQSPFASVPTVSESLPIRILFMAAPWVSIFLSLILSSRIRALGREWADVSRIAFLGAPSQPRNKLSPLDGRIMSFFERSCRLIPALIASIAPIAVSIASHIPNDNSASVLKLTVIYDLVDVRVIPWFAYFLAMSIYNDTKSLIQVIFGFIFGLHILFVIFRVILKRSKLSGSSRAEKIFGP